MTSTAPSSTSDPSSHGPAPQLYRELDPEGKASAAAAKAAEAKARAAALNTDSTDSKSLRALRAADGGQAGRDQGSSSAAEQPVKAVELSEQARSVLPPSTGSHRSDPVVTQE